MSGPCCLRAALPFLLIAVLFPKDASSSSRTRMLYPQRTNDDAALLEWGHSAIIHAADAVVAQFGLQASEEEFELGIEAAPVIGRPQQGCKPFRNAEALNSQMVFVFRGACDFATKAKHAAAAGAVALVVINHDQSRPDYAFSMVPTSEKDEDKIDSSISSSAPTDSDRDNLQIPCVMVSWNSGQAILEDQPERLRLYPGEGRPFIESVSDDSPVVFLIHNLLTEEECEYIKTAARPRLRQSVDSDDDVWVTQKSIERKFKRAVFNDGIFKSDTMKGIDEKLESIINFPPEYFADLQVNYFESGGKYGPHYDSDRRHHLYREKVITVVICLDTIAEDNGGAMVFPRAPLKIRQEAGLAIVYHNTIEDGNLDMSSIHEDEELLNGTKWTATLFIHATPIPLAARTVIPAMIVLSGGEKPAWISEFQYWSMKKFGVDRGYEIFNYCFLGLAAMSVMPFLLVIFFLLKQIQPRAPPTSEKQKPN